MVFSAMAVRKPAMKRRNYHPWPPCSAARQRQLRCPWPLSPSTFPSPSSSRCSLPLCRRHRVSLGLKCRRRNYPRYKIKPSLTRVWDTVRLHPSPSLPMEMLFRIISYVCSCLALISYKGSRRVNQLNPYLQINKVRLISFKND